MTTFVMVHGGAHGAWCWESLVGYLEAPMLAVDLPGRGRRPAALDALTGEDFASSVIADIERLDLRDVILVGHSMGGVTLLRVATRIAARLKRLVFIACPIPEPGKSIGELMLEVAPARPVETSADDLRNGLPEAVTRAMLYNDVDELTIRRSLPRLVPEAMSVYGQTADAAGLRAPVPRTYVRTLKDAAVPQALQQRAISQLLPVDVIDIDAGHNAMQSAPEALAAILNRFVD